MSDFGFPRFNLSTIHTNNNHCACTCICTCYQSLQCQSHQHNQCNQHNQHKQCNQYDKYNCDNLVKRSNLDPAAIADYFLMEYYKNTSNNGWNSIQHLFDHKCIVMYKDRYIGNENDLLNGLSSDHIRRANYYNINIKWLVINNFNILINVFGHIQFVSFSHDVSNIIPFSETFVITLNEKNNSLFCTHHLLDF